MTKPHPFTTAVSTTAFAAMVAYTALNGSNVFAGPKPPPPPPPPPSNPTPPPTIAPTLATGIFTDATGQFTALNGSSFATTQNPFFHPLGTNGRACVTCHREDSGWSITPQSVQQVFSATGGTDPLFRTVDGSNSPNAPVATIAERQTAYSELLGKGLIRIGLPIPANAQFTLTAVNDPYHYASAAQLSLFRRPLPASNLPYLSTVMFDGRATLPGESIDQDLAAQAVNAVETHEQATTAPSAAAILQTVNFETSNFVAQSFDNRAGILNLNGADGGPESLEYLEFYLGINNSFGGSTNGATFNPNVFTLYTSWTPGQQGGPPPAGTTPPQASVAHGEQIFNNLQFPITNVAGLNDVVDKPTIIGTCTTCHDTPGVGDHSLPVFLDLGLTDPNRITPDLPAYTLTNNQTGKVRITSDPGRALITGQWNDIGKFKVPTLRGLASRAPYFHNGSAPDVQHVIGFYNQRFKIGLSPQDQADLAAFLNTL